jgi:membrane-associated protease RseP (regulator of RpoE activity)
MINLDGIGRLREDRLYILGVDSAREFRSLITHASEGSGLQVAFSGDAFGPSDHTSFYARGRPVVMFFTGPHADYHRPSDTADKVSGEGMEKVVRLVYRVVAEFADRSDPLTCVRTKGEPPGVAGERGDGYGAYLGSIPDFAESPMAGVRLSGVRPGSPAEKLGLRAGDVIVGIGGMSIRNLHDLVYALRSKRPGDQVEVIYVRNGKELKAEATLEERR